MANRKELIALCERTLTPETEWTGVSDVESQCAISECLTLLRAGCRYSALEDKGACRITIYTTRKCSGAYSNRHEYTIFVPPVAAPKAKAYDFYASGEILDLDSNGVLINVDESGWHMSGTVIALNADAAEETVNEWIFSELGFQSEGIDIEISQPRIKEH